MKRKFLAADGGSNSATDGQQVDIDEDNLVLLKAVHIGHKEMGEPVRQFVDANGIR